jgi:hypothetical protein
MNFIRKILRRKKDPMIRLSFREACFWIDKDGGLWELSGDKPVKIL